jgi:hypothetical protein
MRVLLDECLPRSLKKHPPGHDVITVPEAGWSGTTNGQLLRIAAGKFDAFVTIDNNMIHQQSLGGLPFIVVVLLAQTNRLISLACARGRSGSLTIRPP